ncbi:unnamed protein product [Linum trigynum]|uniref:Uncharacterized protein n=1 Tax=Linum trigynum TaxID=586398 RepID=A0AAV2DWA3_9ROSI
MLKAGPKLQLEVRRGARKCRIELEILEEEIPNLLDEFCDAFVKKKAQNLRAKLFQGGRGADMIPNCLHYKLTWIDQEASSIGKKEAYLGGLVLTIGSMEI